VCDIDGDSNFLTGDERGVQLRAIVDGVATTLQNKYGPYKKIDTCKIDTQECSEFWAEKLNEGAQEYVYDWDFSRSPRPDRILEIDLEARATNSITSLAVVSYFSADTKGCSAARKSAAGASL
jgi:hypothetical protein